MRLTADASFCDTADSGTGRKWVAAFAELMKLIPTVTWVSSHRWNADDTAHVKADPSAGGLIRHYSAQGVTSAFSLRARIFLR
jgi:hypothetical protein